jgi:hypothetical protein
VLDVDLLQSILNRAMQQDLISAPLPGPTCPDFPVIQYADDTLVVMKADEKQILCLKAILQSFADSTGLTVNYNKSSMMPINMSQERLQHFANTLQCRTGCLPFTYLGLPLVTTKPSLNHFMPIVQRVEKKAMWYCGLPGLWRKIVDGKISPCFIAYLFHGMLRHSCIN